jgi:hypothetical protein
MLSNAGALIQNRGATQHTLMNFRTTIVEFRLTFSLPSRTFDSTKKLTIWPHFDPVFLPIEMINKTLQTEQQEWASI